MTIASFGTTATSGGGCARSTLLVRQELEAPLVAFALPPPPARIQEPVKQNRGRDAYTDGTTWSSKKQRSAVAAARERGNAIAEANWEAAAAASPPIFQEPAGKSDAVDCICKKGHRSPGWGACVAVDEEKLRPCEFAAPVHGLDGLIKESEVAIKNFALPLPSVQKPMKRDHYQNGDAACWLIKKSCATTTALFEGSNGAVGQVNLVGPSTPSPGIWKPVSRSPPKQGAEAAGWCSRKNTKHSDQETMKQRFMSLSSRLQCLGVTNVTPVLARTLTRTDSRLDQGRLQFSPRKVMDSPLMGMLTPDERQSMHKEDNLDGLQLEALDRHGRSYDMRFGYLGSNNAYRLRKEWTKFLRQNDVREGDGVEVGAFRVDGRLMLTMLNYAMEGWIPEEIEAAKGLLMLSDFKDGTKS